MNDQLAQMQGGVPEQMVIIKPEVDDTPVVQPTPTETAATTATTATATAAPTSYPSTSIAPIPTVSSLLGKHKASETKENVKKKMKNSPFKPKIKVMTTASLF